MRLKSPAFPLLLLPVAVPDPVHSAAFPESCPESEVLFLDILQEQDPDAPGAFRQTILTTCRVYQAGNSLFLNELLSS